MFNPSDQQYGAGNYESYVQFQEDTQKGDLKSLYGRARVQFIQKVYTILSIQLVFTAVVSVFAMYSEAFLRFQAENTWLLIVAFVGMIVTQIYILCCNQGRQYPTNMILLGIFTLCQAYFVSFICGATAGTDGKQIVLVAALMTAVMVIACTIYAFTTETDFTTSWGFIVVLSAAMLVLAIMSIFSNSLFIHNLYCALGVILFGFYLIIDTQMIMGGKNAELTVDDYVVASFCLYVDIIQIFLYILDLLRSNNND